MVSAARASHHTLSKGEVLAGLQCYKQLWWIVHEPGARELVPDVERLAQMQQGTAVGRVARDYVRDPGTLYEKTFVAPGATVRTDILRPAPDGGYDLVEV